MATRDRGAGDDESPRSSAPSAAASPADAATTGSERLPPPPDDGRGNPLIVASWVGTVIYTVTAIGATFATTTFQAPLVIVCLVLFTVGCLAAVVAYAIAIGRSRDDEIGMGGLFFLAGSAPPRVRRHLVASLVVEVLVAIATSSIGIVTVPEDAYNVLAFGVLVPMYGLGLAGMWAARWGSFSPRVVEPRPAARERLDDGLT